MIDNRFQRSAGCGLSRQSVLHHLVANTCFAQLPPQLLVLGHGHVLKTDQHRRIRLLELFREGVEVFLFLCLTFHFRSSLISQTRFHPEGCPDSSSMPGSPFSCTCPWPSMVWLSLPHRLTRGCSRQFCFHQTKPCRR